MKTHEELCAIFPDVPLCRIVCDNRACTAYGHMQSLMGQPVCVYCGRFGPVADADEPVEVRE